jgi:hypothetical protein
MVQSNVAGTDRVKALKKERCSESAPTDFIVQGRELQRVSWGLGTKYSCSGSPLMF